MLHILIVTCIVLSIENFFFMFIQMFFFFCFPFCFGPISFVLNIMYSMVFMVYKVTAICKNDSQSRCRDWYLYESHHKKTCFCHMRTTKAQISLCIHSLLSAFDVCCLDGIIPILVKSKIPNFKISTLCSWAGQFESYLAANWMQVFV